MNSNNTESSKQDSEITSALNGSTVMNSFKTFESKSAPTIPIQLSGNMANNGENVNFYHLSLHI